MSAVYTCSACGHGRWFRVEPHVRQDWRGNGGKRCSSSSLLLTYYPPCSEHDITFHTNRRQQVATFDSRRRNTVPGFCYLPTRESHRRLSQPAALPLKLKVWCPSVSWWGANTGSESDETVSQEQLADTAAHLLWPARPTPSRHLPAGRGADGRCGVLASDVAEAWGWRGQRWWGGRVTPCSTSNATLTPRHATDDARSKTHSRGTTKAEKRLGS